LVFKQRFHGNRGMIQLAVFFTTSKTILGLVSIQHTTKLQAKTKIYCTDILQWFSNNDKPY